MKDLQDTPCIQNAKTSSAFPTFFSTQVVSGDYFHLGEFKNPTELNVVCGGLEKCSKDYRIDRNHFRYYGIEYIVSGSCKITLQNQKFELNSGCVFSYGPHLHHKIEHTGDEHLIKYFIDLSGNNVPDLLWESFLKDNRPWKLNNIKWVSDTFQQLIDCGKMGENPGRSLCNSLAKYLIKRIEVEKITTKQTNSPSKSTYEKTRKYIEEHYLTIKRVSEVAEACHLSLPHLCRLYKRFSNEAPTQVLIRMKLEKSIELISRGDYLIKEIADYVGFEDPFYFSHRFKQHFGVSPSNYLETVSESPKNTASRKVS